MKIGSSKINDLRGKTATVAVLGRGESMLSQEQEHRKYVGVIYTCVAAYIVFALTLIGFGAWCVG